MKVFEPIEDQENPPGAIGWAAGVVWYRNDDAPEEAREPTEEEMAQAMLELPAFRSLKQSVRRKIEAEVGDVHEILADQARQIEALTAMLCRLAADQLGGTAMDADTKSTYLARAENVVAALDSGQLVLRGGMESTDDMLAKVMGRTARMNQIVAEEYLARKEALLNE